MVKTEKKHGFSKSLKAKSKTNVRSHGKTSSSESDIHSKKNKHRQNIDKRKYSRHVKSKHYANATDKSRIKLGSKKQFSNREHKKTKYHKSFYFFFLIMLGFVFLLIFSFMDSGSIGES